ncbi:MAG TPA: SDR family oxidoreductase [Candidatus Anammoximicrobium sp.]|nr:SDR family oxidoreductase [Candidatus Anammoximicrobium sp.]
MVESYLKDLFGLEGQTAVVIGGAGVLGGALCRGLAGAGAHVIVADLTEQGCQNRVTDLKQISKHASFALVDVTSRKSLEDLLATAVQQAGRVHVLVNCAGVNAANDFLEATDADWDRILTINLRAVFQACQVFGRHMIEAGGGAIVNIGSVTSHLPLSRVFAYSASKSGVLNLTRNIAQEFATKGVRVNCICPGFFPAEQNRRVLTPERVDSIMRGTPMKRFGEPDELVGALLLLASSTAGQFITGTHVNVDGGFTAAWL